MGDRFNSHAETFRHEGVKMLGVYAGPAAGVRKSMPGVLFLHGFPGSEKNVDIQRALMARGVASFSLYFAGAWGSGGKYKFSTLPEQAEAGLAHLARKTAIDSRRLAVFGFSMGGWTAIHLGARTRRKLRAVAAVAPVGGPEMLRPGMREFICDAARLLNTGPLDSLCRDFERSMRLRDSAKSAKRLKAPLLLVHGTADETVPCSASERVYAAAPGEKRLIRAKGADHSFLERRGWLARRTADWLASRLS